MVQAEALIRARREVNRPGLRPMSLWFSLGVHCIVGEKDSSILVRSYGNFNN